jgi:catechol 2,3-dioxygenase-like lactoylglutathione lyase family enzyme
VLHHVTLEVSPGDVARATEFWTLLGFAVVEPPEPLAGTATWLQCDGTQIHLAPTESPTVPPYGHTAVVTPQLEQTVEQLRAHDFDVAPKRELWGAPRALAIAPGGHRVELIKAPPER